MMVMPVPTHAFNKQVHESKLVLQLRWDHQFQFAGYYAAQWMGYYEEEGLDVEIRSAFENGEILDAAVEVDEGRADFGVGAANILIAQDSGRDLTLVASIFQRSAVEYCTLLEDRGNSVFDLSQLHIARRPGDLLDLELQALFASEGITPYANRTTTITRDFTLEDLIVGSFEVVPDFLGQISYAASQKGIPLKVIRPAEYGIDFYGDTLFTSSAAVRENPELVEKFRNASIKGWYYALEHPKEISALIVEKFPRSDAIKNQEFRDFNDYQSKKVLELTHYPIVEVGNINPFRWEKMAEAMKTLNMIQQTPNFNEMIFDYDQVKMDQLEKKRQNLARMFLALTVFFTVLFLVHLKRRNTILIKEIDSRKRAQRQLVLSNTRYETIFKSSVLGITITDFEGRIHHVNEAWCRMTGYTADELCTMNINQIIAPESMDVDKALLMDLKAGKISSFSIEKKYLCRPDLSEKQNYFYGRVVLTQIWDSTTDTSLNMSMVTDITREVHEAEAIRRSEERFRKIVGQVAQEIGGTQAFHHFHQDELSMDLEEINLELEKLFTHELEENRRKDALIRYQARMAAMGEMIGSIAHQWRQPLHTLKLVLLNLKDPGNDPDYIEACYVKANMLIRRMSETIDDFRYFSNPRTEPRFFTVEESIKLVIGLMDEQLRVSGITIKVDCSDMPPVYGLDNQFSHVLFNLISNAVDALRQNPPGLPRLIHMEGQKYQSDLLIRIVDSGPGIPKENAKSIFDMYYTTKEAVGGSGLGLPMARSILESAFGGQLSLVESDEGCIFEIQIPSQERSVNLNESEVSTGVSSKESSRDSSRDSSGDSSGDRASVKYPSTALC
jgi:PAS domain S-box-containing protein